MFSGAFRLSTVAALVRPPMSRVCFSSANADERSWAENGTGQHDWSVGCVSGAQRWEIRRLSVALKRGACAQVRPTKQSFSHAHLIHICRHTVEKSFTSSKNSFSAVTPSSSSVLSAERPVRRAFSTNIRASIAVFSIY